MFLARFAITFRFCLKRGSFSGLDASVAEIAGISTEYVPYVRVWLNEHARQKQRKIKAQSGGKTVRDADRRQAGIRATVIGELGGIAGQN
jgi:hypothetical protein